MGQRILLVEGPADSGFYGAFVRQIKLANLTIVPPENYGAKVNSKSNAIHVLPDLLRQLDDGSVSNIGIVVDADYESTDGLGFKGTLEKICQQITPFGFLNQPLRGSDGLLFPHADGFSPFGAWIMPNNQDEGMLEDFIKAAITDVTQNALHQRAVRIVGNLTTPLFKTIHRSKADVATWMAWQTTPGERLESTVSKHLIDQMSVNCVSFSNWLRDVFP